MDDKAICNPSPPESQADAEKSQSTNNTSAWVSKARATSTSPKKSPQKENYNSGKIKTPATKTANELNIQHESVMNGEPQKPPPKLETLSQVASSFYSADLHTSSAANNNGSFHKSFPVHPPPGFQKLPNKCPPGFTSQNKSQSSGNGDDLINQFAFSHAFQSTLLNSNLKLSPLDTNIQYENSKECSYDNNVTNLNVPSQGNFHQVNLGEQKEISQVDTAKPKPKKKKIIIPNRFYVPPACRQSDDEESEKVKTCANIKKPDVPKSTKDKAQVIDTAPKTEISQKINLPLPKPSSSEQCQNKRTKGSNKKQSGMKSQNKTVKSELVEETNSKSSSSTLKFEEIQSIELSEKKKSLKKSNERPEKKKKPPVSDDSQVSNSKIDCKILKQKSNEKQNTTQKVAKNDVSGTRKVPAEPEPTTPRSSCSSSDLLGTKMQASDFDTAGFVVVATKNKKTNQKTQCVQPKNLIPVEVLSNKEKEKPVVCVINQNKAATQSLQIGAKSESVPDKTKNYSYEKIPHKNDSIQPTKTSHSQLKNESFSHKGSDNANISEKSSISHNVPFTSEDFPPIEATCVPHHRSLNRKSSERTRVLANAPAKKQASQNVSKSVSILPTKTEFKSDEIGSIGNQVFPVTKKSDARVSNSKESVAISQEPKAMPTEFQKVPTQRVLPDSSTMPNQIQKKTPLNEFPKTFLNSADPNNFEKDGTISDVKKSADLCSTMNGIPSTSQQDTYENYQNVQKVNKPGFKNPHSQVNQCKPDHPPQGAQVMCPTSPTSYEEPEEEEPEIFDYFRMEPIRFENKPTRPVNLQPTVVPVVAPSALIQEVDGDVFEVIDSISLVHCVAEDLRMGSGIAVDFRKKFKRVPELLQQRCKTGGIAILTDPLENPKRYIYYLVTKPTSISKPTMLTLESSLCCLKQHCQQNNVTHLAMPRIGCGLDLLFWSDVRELLHRVFAGTNICIYVFTLDNVPVLIDDRDMHHLSLNHIHHINLADIDMNTGRLFLASEGQDTDETMEKLNKKFNFLPTYLRTQRNKGDCFKFECKFPEENVYGLVVRGQSGNEPIDYRALDSALRALGKHNRKDKYEHFGIEAYYEENDKVVMEKLVTAFRWVLSKSQIGLHICWPSKILDLYGIKESVNG